MSETQPTAPDVNPMTEEGARPWHGTANPLEALWLHFTAEIAKLKPKSEAKPAPSPQPNPQLAVDTAKQATAEQAARDAMAREDRAEKDRAAAQQEADAAHAAEAKDLGTAQ